MKPQTQEINIPKPIDQLKLFGYENYFTDFISMYKNKRLPNVILLNGPKGSGKSTFVYHFINYLLSSDEENNYSLDKYEINPSNSSYKLIQNKIHPNLYIIENSEKGENIKIEKIRSCLKFLSKSTYQKNLRIVLIDNAENLNINSSNALLKSLEEPSNNTYFFLIYNNTKYILKTIKTRCLDYKIHFTINEKKIIFSHLIKKHGVSYDLDKLDRYFFFETPGKLLRFISLIDSDSECFYEDSLKNILYLVNEYKKYFEPSLLEIISVSIENFYNLLSINDPKNINNYFSNKNKIIYLICNMKKFNLDKKTLIISIEEILNNETK